MKDIKLDGAHDIELLEGDMQHITDSDETIQSVKIRLLTILYEWYFNILLGIQWFDKNGMFDPEVTENQKEIRIRRTILQTPGVEKIISLIFRVDYVNRGAQIGFKAKTIFGTADIEVRI